MKTEYDDFGIMTNFDNLYNAHKECRKGKRWKDSVAIFDIRGYECTLKLKELLEDDEYELSPYNCFQIMERGKTRNIKSIKYHDRVVQKTLMDNILTPVVEPTFISTNGASQKGKGTDYAMDSLRNQMRAYFRKYHRTDGYILACDMHHYFDSIPHQELNDFYARKFSDEKILEMIRYIHASIPGGVGVPLGNQLSQLDALLMLSDMDHILKERYHVRWYGRYMDDFYLISDSKDHLRECLAFIKEYVEARGMSLNKKKTTIKTLRQGIDYLGFRYYMTESGKVVKKLAKKSIKHHRHKMKKMRKLLDEGAIDFQACIDAHDGWKAHARRGDTYYLLRKMDRWFADLFKEQLNKEDNNGKTTE